MKVVVLSASTGNGHMSAAYAIDAVCQAEGIFVKTFDALNFAPKAFKLWYGGGYEMVVRRSPAAWGHLYKVSDEANMSYDVQTKMDTLFMARLEKMLGEIRPDWVVCTHSLPQPKLALLREKFGFKIAVVVTDLYPHLMWLRGEPDHYFVPNDWTKEILEQRQPGSGAKTTVTGIPINPVFREPFDREETLKMLGAKAGTKLITMTSGGIGGGPFGKALRAMMTLGRDVHIELICGRNEARRKDIERKALKLPHNSPVKVKVRGHINQKEMAMRMHASDFFISKPGGLTTSECLAVGCPMLVYHPFLIPGQEEGNAEFLVTSGAGAQAFTTDELIATSRDLLDHPEKLKKMREISLSHGKPHSADMIVKTLVDLSSG
jgi:processive 1,2-diacylglycerol beta-glucosyltransferase